MVLEDNIIDAIGKGGRKGAKLDVMLDHNVVDVIAWGRRGEAYMLTG